MPAEKNKKKDSSDLFKYILLVILLWVLAGLVLSNVEKPGEFGDMFGALNTLFTGLAFALLIYTAKLQHSELELQRKELAETRNEIRQQKEHLATQNDVLRVQNFENTFFQLLSLLGEIRESVKFVGIRDKYTREGKEAFAQYSDLLSARFQSAIKDSLPNGKTKNEVISICCDNFFTEFQDELGHYFRTLYNLIKLVKESEVSNKRLYTNLIRAQLTSPEVFIIFYDCLSSLGSEKFKPLVEEFSLLKIIKPEMLIDENHYSMYEVSAFGKAKHVS